MKKKQILSLAIITAILGVLIYFQFRSWREFDWAKFRQYTEGVSRWHIGAAIALVYLAYVLRAVRWAIFLKPTAPTSVRRLIAPQIIGFAALGLFGRAGEFARPYLIARKEKLTFTSQLAVWTVERFFDLGAVAVLMGGFFALRGGTLAHLLMQALRNGLHMALQKAGHNLPVALAALAVLAIFLFLLKRASGKAAGHLHARVVAFKEGFNTIHDAKSFVQLVVVSLAMWLMIAGAYVEVLRAYPPVPVTIESNGRSVEQISHINEMRLEHALIIMGCSMFGSVLQLPGGVGGSQLAVIGVLQSPWFVDFNIARELAVSCGIMLWLVTFMSVIPVGLLLARFEKISLTRLNEESTHEEEEVEAEAARTP